MTPDKPSRPATPASQGPKGATPAPRAPTVPTPPTPGGVRAPAETKDSSRQAPTDDASGDPAPPTETGHVDAENRATRQSPRRPLALYPLPVWPD